MEVYNIKIENEHDNIFFEESIELKKETTSMESTQELMEQEESKYSDIENFFNDEASNEVEYSIRFTLNEEDKQNSLRIKEEENENKQKSCQEEVNEENKENGEPQRNNNSTEKETIYGNEKDISKESNYQPCSSQSDSKGRDATQKKNSMYSSDNYTYYQFSDDEIRFGPEDNTTNQIYSPESSYSGNDFKNCLTWIPRSLKIEDSPSTNSIPCAFFCSNENNEINQNDNVIVYLHKFNEDLGIAMPTVYALHKKLKMNIIAMEYSGYGVSFDNFENKNISIVNDLYLILKFIATYLKVPYSNIYIICSEFLASCVIEVINWFECNTESKTTLGGAILIKPEFLEICNGINSSNKTDTTCRTNRNSIEEPNKGREVIHDTVGEPVKDDLFDPDSASSIHEECVFENLKSNQEKLEEPDDDVISNIDVIIDEYVKEQEEITKQDKLKWKIKQLYLKEHQDCEDSIINEEKNCSKIEKTQQTQKENTGKKRNKKKRKSIFYRGFNIFKKKNSSENEQIETYANNICSVYQDCNGITACDMSLFYSNDMKDTDEINKIPFLLFKRILKDTFDINHVKKSIQEVTCPFLIFHQENSSYKNSCSNILLNNAKKCLKKAAFTFDFMNEDFLNIFNWFFSENCNTKEDDKFFNGMLFLYVHPQYKDPNVIRNMNDWMQPTIMKNTKEKKVEEEEEDHNRNKNDKENKTNQVLNHIVNNQSSLFFPKQFFTSPETIIKSIN